MRRSATLRLCEGHTSFIVHLEDFLNGVDIGGCSQIQTQVVLHGRAHDLLKGRTHSEDNPDSSSWAVNTRGTHGPGVGEPAPRQCRTRAPSPAGKDELS